MKKYTLIAIALGLLFGIQDTFAQTFTLKGMFRNRAELRDGSHTLFTEDTKAAFFVNQRSRLLMDYKSDKLDAHISFQDARVWGEQALMTDVASTGLYEAWVKYKFTPMFGIKVGRQELKYDDQRLISWRNWKNWGATYDIAVLQYENDNGFKTHFGLGVNNEIESKTLPAYTLGHSYKYMSYLWLSKKFGDNVTLTFMDIIDGQESTPGVVYAKSTFGPNLTINTGGFSFFGNFYYQTGKNQAGVDVNANFYSALASYKAGKHSFGVGYDHYSGTDLSDTDNDQYNTFDKLWGAGHKYLGYMDHWSKNSLTNTKGSGINDLYVRATLGFSKKAKLEATYHHFSLDKAYLPDATETSGYAEVDKAIGSEVDLMFMYKHSKQIKLWAGYSFAMPGETWEKIKGVATGESEFPQFAFFMVQFTPTFFTNK